MFEYSVVVTHNNASIIHVDSINSDQLEDTSINVFFNQIGTINASVELQVELAKSNGGNVTGMPCVTYSYSEESGQLILSKE